MSHAVWFTNARWRMRFHARIGGSTDDPRQTPAVSRAVDRSLGPYYCTHFVVSFVSVILVSSEYTADLPTACYMGAHPNSSKLIQTHPNSSKLIRAIIFIAIASSSGTLFLKSRPTCGIRGLWARGPYFSLGKLRKYLSNFVKAGERETTNPPTTSLFLIFARKSGLARGWACVFSSVLSFFSRVFARSVLLAVIVGGLVLSRRWAYFASHPQQCLPSSKSSGNFAFYARFFLPCQSARVECLGLHNRLA